MRVFRACLKDSCDYRLYSPGWRRGSSTARATRRYVASGQSLAPAVSKPRVANLTAGRRSRSPCAAARLVPHVARRQARRAAPRRNPAHSGAAHSGQRRADAHRRDAPGPRADPAVSDRAATVSRRDFWEWTRPSGQLARLDYLQMRQQSRAEMALQESRSWPGSKSHRTDEARICPGHRSASASHWLSGPHQGGETF
jgi:hypothetical protein